MQAREVIHLHQVQGQTEAPAAALTAEDLVDLARERLRRHLASGQSQSDVARMLGISNATVSQFLAGTYRGNGRAVAERILSRLEIEGQRAVAPKAPGFQPTSIAQEVMFVLDHAHIYRDLGLVYGDAGLGKTMAIQEYVRLHRDAIFITASPFTRSPKALIKQLLAALGKYERGPRDEQARLIIETLRDSGRLIVIDEAQHLSYPALEVLRSIHDQAGVGLVLAGNLEVFDRMHGRGQAAFAQLFSRVGVRRCLQTACVSEDDVRLIARQVAPLDGECIRYLHEVANTRGGIRQMVKLLVLAANSAVSAGRLIDLDLLRSSRQMVMV